MRERERERARIIETKKKRTHTIPELSMYMKRLLHIDSFYLFHSVHACEPIETESTTHLVDISPHLVAVTTSIDHSKIVQSKQIQYKHIRAFVSERMSECECVHLISFHSFNLYFICSVSSILCCAAHTMNSSTRFFLLRLHPHCPRCVCLFLRNPHIFIICHHSRFTVFFLSLLFPLYSSLSFVIFVGFGF